jgi:hypothetical protein
MNSGSASPTERSSMWIEYTSDMWRWPRNVTKVGHRPALRRVSLSKRARSRNSGASSSRDPTHSGTRLVNSLDTDERVTADVKTRPVAGAQGSEVDIMTVARDWGSARVPAPDCGVPEGRSHFAAGLILYPSAVSFVAPASGRVAADWSRPPCWPRAAPQHDCCGHCGRRAHGVLRPLNR